MPAPLLSCTKDEESESLEERLHHEFAKVVKAKRKQKKVMTEGFAPLLAKRVEASGRPWTVVIGGTKWQPE